MAMLWSTSLLALGAILQNGVKAQVPTWPTLINDDLEDIMFLNSGYRSRGFSAGVTPCSAAPAGTVGRIAAAEWLRTAFHDMARYAILGPGQGGLDGSLAYELTSGQNKGAAFNTTLTTYEPFMSPYVGLADLIAMGVYTSVRSCGGAPVGIRYGRIDATKSNGDVGTPQPEDGQGSFIGAFNRMGFDVPGMIQVTACGHTIGGVHGEDFPLIVNSAMNCPNNYCPMDTTNAAFDNQIAKEYTSNTSPDPLVYSALSYRYKRQSDLAVFSADGNATIKTLTDPNTFRTTCQTVLQKLIEVVPSTVTLSTNTIVPYEVKPYGINLFLNNGGSTLSFTGDIRVRTTTRGTVSGVQLLYTDRNGATGGTITATATGTANGFDDTFSFFSFASTIPASSSISSFSVVVTSSGGGTETFKNNGAGFPVQDSLLFQAPQSCLSGNTLTVSAAVRNTASGTPNLNAIQRVYTSGLIPPKFPVTSNAMTASNNVVGAYSIYSYTVSLTSGSAAKANFNITLGSIAVPLQSAGGLTNTCGTLSGSGNSTNTTTTTTTTTAVSTTTASANTTTSSTSTTTSSASTTSATTATTSSSSTTTSSTSTTSTSVVAPSGASYLGCYVDSVSKRTFDGASTADTNSMTLESCASFCSSYKYFGTEYGQECYCGNNQPDSSLAAPSASDCNMPCTGNSQETCGAGNRLSTFTNLNYNAAVTPNMGKYIYQGCFTDSVSARALSDDRLNDNSLTIEKCAAYCSNNNYAYFGTEYSSECYCGNQLASTSSLATNTDCYMVCSGNSTESCGGPNRIDLWSTTATTSSKREVVRRGRTQIL